VDEGPSSRDVLTETTTTLQNALVLPVVDLPDRWRAQLKSPYYRYLGGVYCEGKGVPEALLVRAAETFEGADRAPDGRRYGELQAPEMYPVTYRKGDHVLCGRAFPHLAHFICESLARIWLAMGYPDLTLVWTGASCYTPLQEEILALLGIRNKALFVQEPVEVERLVVPSQGHIMPTFHAPYFLDAIAVVYPAPVVPGKKTFVARTNAPNGGYVNEPSLVAMLRDAGWNILYPERIPFAARFEALSSSEVILLVEGAAITPFLFFRELHSQLFTLSRNDPEQTGYDVLFRDYFGAMAREKGWRYRRLDPPKRWISGRGTEGRFELDLNAFADLMNETAFLSQNLSLLDGLARPCPYPMGHDVRIAVDALSDVTDHCDDTSACIYRGALHDAARLPGKAIEELWRALSLDPGNAGVRWQLALLLQRTKALPAAAQELQRMVDLSGGDIPAVHAALAQVLRDQGKMPAAIDEARKAVDQFPDAPGFRTLLGELLMLSDAREEALLELACALDMDPRFAAAHILSSRIFLRNGDVGRAIAAAGMAIACDDTQPGYHVHLARLLAQQGALDSAADSARKALSIDASYDWAILTLAEIRAQAAARMGPGEGKRRRSAVGSIVRRARRRLERAVRDLPWNA